MLNFERIIDGESDPRFPTQRWRGASGRVYFCTYFRLAAMPPCGAGVYVIAHWDDASECWRPLWIEAGGGIDPALLLATSLPLAALHVHVHLLAGSEGERLAIAADLARAHRPGAPAAPALPRRPTAEAAD
jgi:hypothetical protein